MTMNCSLACPNAEACMCPIGGDYDQGVRDALGYAAGFLVGAADGATVFGLPAIAKAFVGAATELGRVTPSMVKARRR